MRARKSIVSGFTLVELLVVIAIIGVLVALLLPAVQPAREAARRTSCSNNLKQLGLGLHNYHDVFRVFPYGHHYRGNFDGDPTNNEGGTGYGWAYALLPFIEQNTLFQQFNGLLPVSSTALPSRNAILAQTSLAVFGCPSDTKPRNFNDGGIPNSATSSYQGCGTSYDGWSAQAVGVVPNPLRFNGLFCRDNRGDPYGMNQILDGTSQTFAIGETKWRMDNNGRNRSRIFGATDNASFATGASNALLINGQWQINWTQPQGNPNPHRTAGSNHPGGAQFAFIDGSVRFVPETIQHTATAWIDNANAFDRPNLGRGYGLYQRLYSVDDSLIITNF
jgi:prepilin-type N-terminal cleavage/methylation domain-containing protein/prepilin-type processing-associated H-X9-DG protein